MRFYQDISHFRAPYKNYQTLAGFGADTGAPAAPPAWSQYASKGEDGILYFNDVAKKGIYQQLLYTAALPVSENVIRAETLNPQTLAEAQKPENVAILEAILKSSAAYWLDQKIAAGFGIAMPLTALNVAGQAGTPAGLQIAAVSPGDYQQMVDMSNSGIGAVYAKPKAGWTIPAGAPAEVLPAGISDPKHALIALAIIGGAGILFFGVSRVMKRRQFGRPTLSGSLAR